MKKEVLEKKSGKSVEELRKQNMGLVKSSIELAEAKKKIEDRDVELISLTSHEMKTPLTSVISILQLILDKKMGEINEKQKEGLDKALYNANRLDAIVKNMINISRIEENRVAYKFNRFDMSNLIRGCANTVQSMLKEKNINLKILNKSALTVVADKAKIEQVVLNLLTNSIRYGKHGGNIWISLTKGKDGVTLSVKDDGRGIPKKDIPRLFTKNFQSVKGKKRVLGGLGYGLYISKKILDRHKGKIWVKSILEKGSTFYVSLPVNRKFK